MTVGAAAKQLTIPEPTFRARIDEGSIRAMRIAEMILIHQGDLEVYLRQHPDQRL
jgi:excisionase family DNA binding protein